MISEVYTELFANDLLWERYLRQGVSPSANQTEAIIGQVAAMRLGLTGSSLAFDPQPDTEGSARAISEALETFSREIRTVLEGSRVLQTRGKRLFDRAEAQVSLIAKQATELGIQACALQLGRQEGLTLSNYDTMATMSFIDQQRSSVEFNPRTRAATLKRRPIERRVDLTDLQDTAFNVFVSQGESLSQSVAPNSRFNFAVDDSDSYWMHRVVTTQPGVKTLTCQIDMGKPVIVSKIAFTPFTSDTSGGLEIRILGSINRVNWRELHPATTVSAPRLQVDGVAVRARYLRVEMTLPRPTFRTSSNFIYEFGLNDFCVFETWYYPSAVMVSKPIKFTNPFGIPQRINRLKFNFNDERPLGTDIIYYVATTDNLDSAIRVKPDEEILLETVLEDRQDQGKVRSRFDANHALIDTRLQTGFIPESVRFFRNTFQQDVLIEGIQTGWKLENSYYNCVFETIEEVQINLGVNFAFIDGKKVNGIQIIQPGFHTFRTHETNWRPADTEAEDPLFPHNHKLLIEGLTGSETYVGASFIAAQELRLISAFDMLQLGAEFDQFFGLRERFPMIKITKPPVFLDEIEGWRLEQHAIRYKYVSSDTTNTTTIRLIARLTSQNPRLTPTVKGYVALAGY